MKKIEQLKDRLLSHNLMKKKRHSQRKDGGCLSIKVVHIVIFGIVAIMYALSNVFNNKSLLETILSIVPFLVLILINVLFKKGDTANIITFFILGLIIYINGSIDNLIGVVFLLTVFDNKKLGTIHLILVPVFIIALALKSNMQNMTQIQVLVSIVGSGYIVYFYFVRLKPKETIVEKEKPIIRNIDVMNITEEEKAIVKMYCNGMSYENISKFLGINNANDTIRRKITKVKNDNNLKNDAKLGKWLFESV